MVGLPQGAFSFDFRRRMIYEGWQADLRERGVPLSSDFRVETLLTNDVEIARWASESLPGDELSIQNGILTLNSTRFPLCIDPQQQAVKWIKRHHPDCRRTSFNSPNFLNDLKSALLSGLAIVFENVDEYIDPIIDPVLEQDVKVSPLAPLVSSRTTPWEANGACVEMAPSG